MAHIVIQNEFVEGGAGNTEKPVIIVEQADGVVTLRRENTPYRDQPLTIDPTIRFEPWKLHVIYWGAGQFHYVTDHAESRDKEAFMRQHFGCTEGIVAEVGWGATPDECAVLTFRPTYYEGEYHRFQRHDRSANFIDEVIPGFAARRIGYTNARRAALNAVRPHDSLAELEKQVDLLTDLVLRLVDKALPKSERPSWHAQFKAVFAQTDSTQFKCAADNIDAIAETKGRLRQMQKEYFANRGY